MSLYKPDTGLNWGFHPSHRQFIQFIQGIHYKPPFSFDFIEFNFQKPPEMLPHNLGSSQSNWQHLVKLSPVHHHHYLHRYHHRHRHQHQTSLKCASARPSVIDSKGPSSIIKSPNIRCFVAEPFLSRLTCSLGAEFSIVRQDFLSIENMGFLPPKTARKSRQKGFRDKTA